jgi:glycosyltransferase involved in cell wall biosynthesis
MNGDQPSNSLQSAAARLRILFYAPFKPLNHPHPSGDQATAKGIFDFLSGTGHRLEIASSFRCRWLFWRPWLWPRLFMEQRRIARRFSTGKGVIWLTYHTYYKAPDLLGPHVAVRLNMPYVIFQGIYSTKRRRSVKTWPGFVLNRRALLAAQHVFTNKRVDLYNLRRLLPAERITYVAPGIQPEQFNFDRESREQLRRSWNIGDEVVVFSAAMFRPDVKTKGLIWVIRACGDLVRRGRLLRLVIAGDGKEKPRLQKLAAEELGDRVSFVGKVARSDMYRYYSAGDVFAFPGFNESLGMVFLEAQACGLPVVAFSAGGIPEVVQDGKTGLLVPYNAFESFVGALERLLIQKHLRQEMGLAARVYVRQFHNLQQNYQIMDRILGQIGSRHTD